MSSRTKKLLLLALSNEQEEDNNTVLEDKNNECSEQNVNSNFIQEPIASTSAIISDNEASESDFDSDDSVVDKIYIPESESSNSSDENNNQLDLEDVEDEPLEPPNVDINPDQWTNLVEINEDNNNSCHESAVLNFDISLVKNPLDAYLLFLSKDVIQLIVQETNTFARQMINTQNSSRSRLNLWVDCDEIEIKRFFFQLF